MKSLQTSQRELTTERILDGALEVLRSGQSLTFALVAAAAELPERTVYRHFETRDVLEKAAWKVVLAQFANDELPRTLDEYCAQTKEAFRRFSADPGLVRAILHSRQVVRLRRLDDSARRAALEECVRSAHPQISTRECRRAAAALRVLHAAPSWELLTDLWGFDAPEAAKVVELAARSILAGLRRRNDVRD